MTSEGRSRGRGPSRWADPRRQRRLGPAAIAGGGLLAGIGTALRASGSGSGAYLLDVLGWFVVIGGAVLEASAAGIWFEIGPRAARVRAIALLAGGLAAAILGCVAASSIARNAGAVVEAAAMFVLVAGTGSLLAGFFSLAWTIGGDYAARRIERLGEEEW